MTGGTMTTRTLNFLPLLKMDWTSAAAADTSPAARTTPDGGDGSVGAATPYRRPPTDGTPSHRSVGVAMTDAPPGFGGGDEFSLADSFVLGALRTFRLLQSAGLNAVHVVDLSRRRRRGCNPCLLTRRSLASLDWAESSGGRSRSRWHCRGPFAHLPTVILLSLVSIVALRPPGLVAGSCMYSEWLKDSSMK